MRIHCFVIFIFFSFLVHDSYSYVFNQTKFGIPLHWTNSNLLIDVFINSENTQGLSDDFIQTVANNSVNEWNGVSGIHLRKNATIGKEQVGLNEIYFSNDTTLFNGTGVIGVTVSSFNETSGAITEADILINDNFSFSTSVLDSNYLGNVITHELGHFLGLGHGQVVDSTMFYSLTLGQSKIANDDKAGVYSLYATDTSSISTSLGSITGTIVGGKKLAVVFGAHVQAISVKTGKVMGAVISELDGRFKINGLPRDDQYLIYTSPTSQLGLPTNYSNVRNDFCESSTKYRGSFFQSCGARSEGFPQAVKLNSVTGITTGTVDVGKITIRCGLDVSPEYIQDKRMSSSEYIKNKIITPSSFNLNDYAGLDLGGYFVGFFSSVETKMSPIIPDYFRINLSHVENWDAISTNPNLYVELKILNSFLGSAFKANINLTRGVSGTGAITTPPLYIQDSDGWVDLDTIVHIPINRIDPSENNFEVIITPDFKANPSGVLSSFTYPDVGEQLYFYLAVASIVKSNGDGTFSQVLSKSGTVSDNSMCPDAINTYQITKFTIQGGTPAARKGGILACGSVALIDKDSDHNGPAQKINMLMGLLVGLFMALLIALIFSYVSRSRYSKMA